MGRGRAKAKQVKIARRLKYDGSATDLDRLRNELAVGESAQDGQDHDGASLYTDDHEG